MAKIIKNSKDLDKLLSQVSARMLLKTRDIVYDAIQKSIEEYYSEFKPGVYRRRFLFMSSLVKTEIKRYGNELRCEVKIDEGYLNYAYPNTGRFNPSYPHDFDGRFAMGRDVVNWANRKFPDDEFEGGNHGFTGNSEREEGFWDGALEELGDIILILKKNLLNQGIKIV